MNKGEKIVCIKCRKHITEGSIYTILNGSIDLSGIIIKNNIGLEIWIQKSCFITLADFRNNRINEILDETN